MSDHNLKDDAERLLQENQELRQQFERTQQENQKAYERYIMVERQNSDLASIYVASQQLHSTFNYEEVLRVIKEIIVNLVGSESFGIYLLDENAGELTLIAHEGLEDPSFKKVSVSNGLYLQAMAENAAFITADASTVENAKATVDQPLAVIPLRVEKKPVGCIVIYALLAQKGGFQPLDQDLFTLLGNQAITALYASKLFSVSNAKQKSLQDFLSVLRS